MGASRRLCPSRTVRAFTSPCGGFPFATLATATDPFPRAIARTSPPRAPPLGTTLREALREPLEDESRMVECKDYGINKAANARKMASRFGNICVLFKIRFSVGVPPARRVRSVQTHPIRD